MNTFAVDPIPAYPMTLPEAIAREEGWYMHLAVMERCQRNANPGNIDMCDLAAHFGAVLETPIGTEEARFACFPSRERGWCCLMALLLRDYKGMTLEAIIRKYAPENENDTEVYLTNVSNWIGLNVIDVPPILA